MPPTNGKLWIPGVLQQTTTTTSHVPKKHLTDQIRRAEALSLYREILRTSKHFHWTDAKGQPWNKMLRDQARKDFAESRHETDPLILARMLVAGRDGLQQVQNKFNEATAAAWKRIDHDNSKNNRNSNNSEQPPDPHNRSN